MSRLVVVSNRVAVPGESRAGGLAVGLLAALKAVSYTHLTLPTICSV